MNVIKVMMADLNIGEAPNVLKTTGLGSCVGIALYDKNTRIGGLAHIMLPSSKLAANEQINSAKYADTAVPILLENMLKLGAERRYIVGKLVGGAQMFQFKSSNDMLRIGPRNVEAAKQILMELGIPIIAEDTGGSYGRTIELDLNSGVLQIRTANKGVAEI